MLYPEGFLFVCPDPLQLSEPVELAQFLAQNDGLYRKAQYSSHPCDQGMACLLPEHAAPPLGVLLHMMESLMDGDFLLEHVGSFQSVLIYAAVLLWKICFLLECMN